MSITLKSSKSADSKENISDIQVDMCVTSVLDRSGKTVHQWAKKTKLNNMWTQQEFKGTCIACWRWQTKNIWWKERLGAMRFLFYSATIHKMIILYWQTMKKWSQCVSLLLQKHLTKNNITHYAFCILFSPFKQVINILQYD